MSGTRYPKSSPHPCSSVGECETTNWPESTDVNYPGGGPKATDYNGDKSKTLTLGGGEGGKTSKDFPKKKRSFGTVDYSGGS